MRNKHTSILISVSILSTLLALFIVNSTNTVSDISYGEVHIVTDTVWDLANGTYYIEGNVTVDFGINLTIEPGVMVLFNGPYSLYIEGNLTALGNAANMIKFTSNFTTPQRGDWNRIQVNATGYAEIIYCNITYARTAINLNESSRNDVHNNLISNNLNGIELFKSSSNIISNNNITYNEHSGVFIEESINNTLSGNNISKSVRQGVQIYLGSTNNTVSDNNIFQNGWAGLNLYKNSGNIYLSNEIHDNIHGIDTYESFSNEFRYNNIYSNFLSGISLSRSNDNVITNNNISFNGYDGSGTGIYLSSSVNNSVFHNTIIDNEEQAFDDEDTNIWDDGYPYGGNFWSDYNGSDDKRGPYQDVPGSDGIGDTNYSIDSDSFDNFPLMNITLNVAPLFIILSSPANNSIISEGTLIDFDILLENPPFVNYSKNGESNVTFFDPYQIVTTGWDDGDCTIEVFVVDERGNVNSSWFFFVIDSERPIIELVSPSNNSIIAAQAIIDISIIEPNIKSVFYILNNDSVWDLLFPYDINCSTWSEGDYWIEVHAEDLAGNKNSSVYAFTVDLLPPRIVLLSPLNNSYIKPGIFINVSITDMHLDPTTAYYIVDGNSDTFSTPFLIDTSSWQDDNYKVEVVAFDTLGHSATQFYNITVDSQPPSLVLNYPHNNSVIAAGVTLNFSASDVNPLTFRYYTDILGGEDIFPPYDIDTSTWKDRDYIIEVNVSDSAGNFNLSLFQFSIDSSKPEIILRDPSNNSSITSGTPIAFEIDEPHISFANYSVDGGEFQDLLSVMIIDTTGWQEGPHTVEIFALDIAGNDVLENFTFHVDNTPPKVASTSPQNDDKGVSVDTTITIKFSEPMDKTSVANALSITPAINYGLLWSPDNLSLIITPSGSLKNGTTYKITINTTATDLAGNPLTKDFVLKFTTGPYTDYMIWLMFIAIVAIIIILLLVLTRRRKRKAAEEVGEEEEEEEEGEGEEEEEEDEFKLGKGEVEGGKDQEKEGIDTEDEIEIDEELLGVEDTEEKELGEGQMPEEGEEEKKIDKS